MTTRVNPWPGCRTAGVVLALLLTAPGAGLAQAAQGSAVPVPPSVSSTTVQAVEHFGVRCATVAGVEPRFHSLDIHAPKGAHTAPVIVYVHGGYWRAGGKSAKGHLPVSFGRRGFVFVTINYRLAPAAQHPAQVQDVDRAVAWVHDHTAE